MTRRSTTQCGPSAAERVRSAFTRASNAVLAIDGADPVSTSVHYFNGSGEMIVAVPDDCPATALAWQSGATGLPVVLELTDLAPVRLREPVRALVWIRGTLNPVDPATITALTAHIAEEVPDAALLDVGHTTTLLRLRMASTVITDHSGAEAISIDELAAAEPDPFSRMETCWLRHLESDHADMLAMIIRKLPRSTRAGNIRPLGLDRFGLRLRIEHLDGEDRDVRIAFPAPVDTPEQLNQALRLLMGCPFLNGLRTQRQ